MADGRFAASLILILDTLIRGVSAPFVSFTWGVQPRATVCTVRNMVCTKCSTTIAIALFFLSTHQTCRNLR